MEQKYVVIWEVANEEQFTVGPFSLDEATAFLSSQTKQFQVENIDFNRIQIQKEGY